MHQNVLKAVAQFFALGRAVPCSHIPGMLCTGRFHAGMPFGERQATPYDIEHEYCQTLYDEELRTQPLPVLARMRRPDAYRTRTEMIAFADENKTELDNYIKEHHA